MSQHGRPNGNIGAAPEQVTPLYDKLLVKRIQPPDQPSVVLSPLVQTLDGRWLDKTDDGPRYGVVVAAGRGEKPKDGNTADGWARHAMAVRLGDTIIYPRFESSHVMLNGEQFTFVNEGDVLAVLER